MTTLRSAIMARNDNPMQIKNSRQYLKLLFGKTKVLLFLIILFGLFLRLAFFSGMGTSDDMAYSGYAYNIGSGIDLERGLTLSTRIGIVYTTALSYKLFGVNDFSSVLFVLLTSIAGIILVFYFGKLLFNEKIGLMAAFLLAIFPANVADSTKLLTDIPSAFFMSLGVYFFLHSEIKSGLKYGYFLSGIFIGIGYLIRESAIIIGLFFLIYVLYKRQIKKEYFIAAAGFLVMLGVELLVLYALTGNPLFRFTAVQDYLLKATIQNNYFGRLSFPQGLFHYPYIILTDSLISYFYILIFIAISYLLIRKKRDAYVLIFWFISLLLYLSFGSGSFTEYIPFKATPRYLSVITIPGILLLACFLMEKARLIRKIVMPAALIALLAASVTTLYLQERTAILDNLRDVYPHLKTLDKPIYTDSRSVKALAYVSSYQKNMDIRDYPDGLGEISDSYVIVNNGMVRTLKETYKDIEFPKEIFNPPKSWTIEIESGSSDEDRIIVYYAPKK